MARFTTEQREIAYRIYVTDSLKSIGRLNKRYFDLISDDFVQVHEPTETADEIVNRIKNGINNL